MRASLSTKQTIAINGLGRIGRCVLRAFLERPELHAQFEFVAANEAADTATIIHLLKYDSTHGRLPAEVRAEHREGQEYIILEHAGYQHCLRLSHHESLSALSWPNVDVLMECTGQFSLRSDAEQHIQQGAKTVLFSQPACADVDATIVYGVNHTALNAQQRIISNASCTTNALVPVLHSLHQQYGVAAGAITTLHSAMNDQPVIDAYHHTDLRKTRAAIGAMIPVHTELAKGIERLLPELSGRFTAHAIRVPTINVSAIDLTVTLCQQTSKADVNALLQAAALQHYQGVMSVTEEKLTSTDFNHDPHSVIIDASQTQVVQGNMVKLLLWFDNEWGYANRMLDVAAVMQANAVDG
ncbi:MAG: erythrose-4-phosphate dehydrogenase [Pseudomonadales bacterium]|nr:erythrose-4-phosphate dehydrogenase [Pseudomonadales bacterium]